MSVVSTFTPDHRLDIILAGLESAGVCVIEGAIDQQLVSELRSAVEAILAQERPSEDDEYAGSSQRIGEIITKRDVFRKPLVHPLVLAIWRRLLGPDMVCSTWTANTVMPHSGSSGWHADFPFRPHNEPFPTDWLAAQTIWLLDDFTAANGATGCLPGSHLFGHGPTRREQDPAGMHILEAPAGSVVLAHGAWWHSSRRNDTDHPRSCLLGMYTRSYVMQMEDMRDQLSRINDPTEEEVEILGGKLRQPTSITTGIPHEASAAG